MKRQVAIVFAVAMFLSSASFAGTGLNIGAIGGFSSVSSGGTSTSAFGFGGRAGYLFDPSWEVSADFTYMSTTPSGAAAGFSSNLALVLADLDYHFIGNLLGLYLGPKVGLGFTSSGGFSGSSFAVGGEAGYDFTFGNLSVGPLIVFESVSAPTLNGVAGNSSTVFNALAAVKYWF